MRQRPLLTLRLWPPRVPLVSPFQKVPGLLEAGLRLSVPGACISGSPSLALHPVCPPLAFQMFLVIRLTQEADFDPATATRANARASVPPLCVCALCVPCLT